MKQLTGTENLRGIDVKPNSLKHFLNTKITFTDNQGKVQTVPQGARTIDLNNKLSS